MIPDDRREHLRWTAITEGDKVPAGPLKGLGELELRIVAEPS
ncbi:hypothetical protein ACIA5D_17780 [Actinoplanes sp. NPDC051513]